jgi:thiosulfate dehydrogenase
MFRAFVFGFVLGVLALSGGLSYYFASGIAPAAVSDSPMPFESRISDLSLKAHIQRQTNVQPTVVADEANLLEGATLYGWHCAFCHGLPGRPSSFAKEFYPPPSQLFEGRGITDRPVFETYWKVVNGIRLTGMPAFKDLMDEKQCWQVSQLLAKANQLPDGVKVALGINPPVASTVH